MTSEDENLIPEESLESAKTYSVVLRLRRVITEDCYVAVPVTNKILKPNPDGSGSIDFEAFVKEAIRISQREGVDWQVEDSSTEPHPSQGPIPEGRQSYDAFYFPDDEKI